MDKIYMDISPLFEKQWSGIARVTAELASGLLRTRNPSFFYRNQLVDHHIVHYLLESQSATGLEILQRHGKLLSSYIGDPEDLANSSALYSNLKRDNKRFGNFNLVVYDLSFVIVPEFHDDNMTEGYRRHLYTNVRDAKRILAISHACKRDLEKYYEADPNKIFVAHLGCNHNIDPVSPLRKNDRSFFLILGTIEPRKNVELILDYIMLNRKILDQYDFIFVGKHGWGKSFSELMSERNIYDNRVRHIGYVSDTDRDQMLVECSAVIFPSFFEGYGLPVTEAMARRRVVIASQSSGIVEAGGGFAISFDPTNLGSFSTAIDRFTKLSSAEKSQIEEKSFLFASENTWESFVTHALEGFNL